MVCFQSRIRRDDMGFYLPNFPIRWDFHSRSFGSFILYCMLMLYFLSELYARDRLIGVEGHIFLTFAAIYKCYAF